MRWKRRNGHWESIKFTNTFGKTIEIKQGRLLHVPLALPHGVQAPAIGVTATFAGSGAQTAFFITTIPF